MKRKSPFEHSLDEKQIEDLKSRHIQTDPNKPSIAAENGHNMFVSEDFQLTPLKKYQKQEKKNLHSAASANTITEITPAKSYLPNTRSDYQLADPTPMNQVKNRKSSWQVTSSEDFLTVPLNNYGGINSHSSNDLAEEDKNESHLNECKSMYSHEKLNGKTDNFQYPPRLCMSPDNHCKNASLECTEKQANEKEDRKMSFTSEKDDFLYSARPIYTSTPMKETNYQTRCGNLDLSGSTNTSFVPFTPINVKRQSSNSEAPETKNIHSNQFNSHLPDK